MELAISAAKSRLSELVARAERGERVVITKRGEPAAELVACAEERRGGLDLKKLREDCERLGIKQVPPDEARRLIAEFDDPAFSREALGLDDDYEPFTRPPRTS